MQNKPTQICHKKDLQHWGDFHLPQGPSSGGSGLSEPRLPPTSPKFNVPSRRMPTPCVGMDFCSRLDPLRHAIKRTSNTGGTPTCLRGHPVVAVVSPSPVCPQHPTNSTFQAVGSQLHALEWTLQNKPTQICHKRNLHHWGGAPTYLRGHPVVAVVSRGPFCPQYPQNSTFRVVESQLHALEWTLQNKPTQISHKRNLHHWGGAPTYLRGHPVVAVVSPSPVCPQHPQNSTFRAVECQLHALGWTFVQDWIHSDMP